ncbi:hypothetical protein L7F22_028799 [Adiantum nelumboides]|nr:hypothetical protein [Adiantum nelumboides]
MTRSEVPKGKESSLGVPPTPPNVSMDETEKEQKVGKSRGPSYKLRSDIELANDVKKVLEECILNRRVEFTLCEILGIAKWELHNSIIVLMKRKHQILYGPKNDPTGSQGMQSIYEQIKAILRAV